MTVKINGVEPNIFPHVDDLDARDAGRHVEVRQTHPGHRQAELRTNFRPGYSSGAVPKALPRPCGRSALGRMMIAISRPLAPSVEQRCIVRLSLRAVVAQRMDE
jgi:hypothetical protein